MSTCLGDIVDRICMKVARSKLLLEAIVDESSQVSCLLGGVSGYPSKQDGDGHQKAQGQDGEGVQPGV